jgi:putative transposase
MFLNTLDSVAAVCRHVSTYVAAHNSEIPHWAFRGQTPDEMYSGRGADVPVKLAVAKKAAQEARLHANRALCCDKCGWLDVPDSGGGVEANRVTNLLALLKLAPAIS